VYVLGDELVFPPPEHASPEGLIAIGGDVSPQRLLLAYAQGIFPWPSGELPLLWFSPDPRFTLVPDDLHISRSLRKSVRASRLEIRADSAFDAVIRQCARTPRAGQDGTWITDELIDGYLELHRLGYAHSVEAWDGGELVGGLYGVSLGSAFFGESMFAKQPDASKICFTTLVAQLARWDFSLIDCQIYTEHLARFGALEQPRADFLIQLRGALRDPTRQGSWMLDIAPTEALEHFHAIP
jgi:leucyl/phenylalanyl-tRNA--protein transferase